MSATPKDYKPSMDPSGLAETLMHMGSGAFGYMVSRPAGMGATIASMLGVAGEPDVRVGADPKTFADNLQASMTYQPRTVEGKMMSQYNPLALIAKGVDWVGEMAGKGVEAMIPGPVGSALGSGVHEATNMAPGFVGAGTPAAAPAAAALLRGAPGGGAAPLTARGMMQSALKPTMETLKSGEAGAAIDTMLVNGVNVSRSGLDKMQGRVTTLNNNIKDLIASSPATVDKWAVASHVQKTYDQFLKQVDSTSDVAAIQRTWDNFINNPILPDQIPVQLAQEVKQGTYRALGNKSFGEMKGAEIEANKALARGLKDEIAAAVPEVRALNAEESKLLNALPIAERRVLTSASNHPAGLGFLSTNLKNFAGFLANRSDTFKSLVARMLNTTADQLPSMAKAGPALGGMTSAAAMDAELKKKISNAFGVQMPGAGMPPDLAALLRKR